MKSEVNGHGNSTYNGNDTYNGTAAGGSRVSICGVPLQENNQLREI